MSVKFFGKIFVLCVLGAGLAAVYLTGASTLSQAEDGLSREDIKNIVREYLLEEPEIILEAVEMHRQNTEREQRAQAQASIQSNMDYFKSDEVPAVGAQDPAVTVIEFFDYNCGYCKRAFADVQALINDEEDVRVLFVEMPILGPSSRKAAEWALAAEKQGKYFEYHAALMEHRGPKNDESLAAIGRNLDLDVDQLREDANSDDIRARLDKSLEVARSIGISGTPAFIIGDQLYPGYLGDEGMKRALEDARESAG